MLFSQKYENLLLPMPKAISQRNSVPGPMGPPERLHYFEKRKNEIIEAIQQFVELESPSNLKPGVDRLSTIIRSRFEEIGGKVKIHREKHHGNHLQVDFAGARTQAPVLLLGHMDTVYPVGAISRMRCRIGKGRLYGPGVFDMKAGIALILAALQGLQSWHKKFPRPITVFLVSDEEIGSPSSRKITETLARRASAVLVAEPASGMQGAVKTARKGVGEFTLKVTGQSAHAGLDFSSGASAVTELARQIVQIAGLVDTSCGVTLNVGTVQGGTRTNVVAAEASACVDVRVPRMQDAIEIERKLRSLKPFNAACKLEINGVITRPPMERSAGGAALYAEATEIAAQLGWKLQEAAVGGGSDGNLTSALGIPTLDGLGAVGEGAHSSSESILISELPRRAALLAGLIERA
jgi:glutamate carboxypeptidase